MNRHKLLTCAALALCALALALTMSAPTRTAEAVSPALAPVTASPLYRFYNNSCDYHFYTADPDERANQKKQGWTEEQMVGYVFRQPAPGTAPLYRLHKYLGGCDSYFYTLNKSEADNAAQNLAWTFEGVACYVSPVQIAGTAPLYRLYKPLTEEGQALFKSDETHWYDFITNAGGAEFKDAPSAVMYGDAHFYTANGQEKFSAMSGGYKLERTEGYVWTQPVTLGASPKPPAPAPLPESYYTEQLFNLGCTKGPNGGITCPTKMGYFSCEYYRKQGNIKATSCIANFDLASFSKVEANLSDLGCKRFLGRPGEYICESWAGGDACDAAVKTNNGLVTKCFTPRSNLIMSYQNSFGREPTAQEINYWSGEMKAKKLSYKDVMAAHHQWLKSAAAEGERKGITNRSIYEAFGRYATVDEINNITGLIAQDGRNFADLVKGHVAWMTGGSPQQDQELRETIKRAFKKSGNGSPSETQIQDWMAKVKAQKLSFKNLVTALQPASKFPKGS